MKKPHITICLNSKAKRFQESKQIELEKVLKNYNITHKFIDVLAIERFSNDDLAPILVAVGGDGTANTVADTALKFRRKMSVIPLGTFNHFSKDVGFPTDFDGAAKTLLKGRVKKIDLGKANDRIFLNNTVIGFYPHFLTKRESLQDKIGKWPAGLISAFYIIPEIKNYRFKLKINNKSFSIKTNLLVVSNNKYELDDIGLAKRRKLDEGEMYAYFLNPKTKKEMLLLFWRLIFGKINSRDFACYAAKKIEIRGDNKKIRLAIDGESVTLRLPIKYKILKKSLEIIV
ncbi:hypothetical protein KY385_03300 [Candidatus Parcubacteria bacterium]|nr:hypothetical protein [Candidatus Parcubacteria bacterium]